MFLGIQAVIAKSFARIHRSNLINFGILPLQFEHAADYDKVGQGDHLVIKGIFALIDGTQHYAVENATKGYTFTALSTLNEREREVVKKGVCCLLPESIQHRRDCGLIN